MGRLLEAASELDALHRAWMVVRRRTRRTAWSELRKQVAQVEFAPVRELGQLQRELRTGRFRFGSKQGYARKKSGGSRRGITVLGVRDRIVQRAMLDVFYTEDRALQSELGEVAVAIRCPTSFAGSPGRGIPEAISLVRRAIREGARAFAYSDMKDFFPCIPRSEVGEFARTAIADQPFVDLFVSALETELENPQDVEPWLDLFPLGETGVAQGSLLSVLVGNLSLRHFDASLNDDRLTTVRYLDDFVILGEDMDAVAAGFARSERELASVNMVCYAPNDGSHKAAIGRVEEGFDFLGCRIHPDGVAPARRARRKLLRDVEAIISNAKSEIVSLQRPGTRRRTELAYVQALAAVDRKLLGWGDAYRFVTNRVCFSQLDREVDGLLHRFRCWFDARFREASPRERRRMTGIALLADTPPAD